MSSGIILFYKLFNLVAYPARKTHSELFEDIHLDYQVGGKP